MKRQPVRQAVCYMTIENKADHWEALCPLVSEFPLEISKEDSATIDRVVPRARKDFQAFLESFQTVFKLGCDFLSNVRKDEIRNPEISQNHSFEAMKAKFGERELYPISYDVFL